MFAEDPESGRAHEVGQQHHAGCAVVGDQPDLGAGKRDHLVLHVVEQHQVADVQQPAHAAAAVTHDPESNRIVRSVRSSPDHSK